MAEGRGPPHGKGTCLLRLTRDQPVWFSVAGFSGAEFEVKSRFLHHFECTVMVFWSLSLLFAPGQVLFCFLSSAFHMLYSSLHTYALCSVGRACAEHCILFIPHSLFTADIL